MWGRIRNTPAPAGERQQVATAQPAQQPGTAVGPDAEPEHQPGFLPQARGPEHHRGEQQDQDGVPPAITFGEGEGEGPERQVGPEERQQAEDQEPVSIRGCVTANTTPARKSIDGVPVAQAFSGRFPARSPAAISVPLPR
jgi:hypothetical protein